VYRFDGSVGQAGIGEQACRGSEVAAVHSCGPGKGVHGLAWTISTQQDSDESQTVERESRKASAKSGAGHDLSIA